MILAYLITAVLLGACADGFNEKGGKDWGHFTEALEKVLLIIVGYVGGLLAIIPYVAFRIAIFDIAKNITKGDAWHYLGGSCWWDRFLRKFPTHGVTFARVVFLAFAIGFTIREL